MSVATELANITSVNVRTALSTIFTSALPIEAETLKNKTITDLTNTVLASRIRTGTPINAAAATGEITIDGVCIDAETVTIGDNVYEFDTDGSITEGRIQVDISAAATAAQGTLTISGVVIDGETVTIGGRVYEFDTDGSTTGDVAVDISSYAVASQGTLTFSGVVVHGETLVIATHTWTFKTDGTAGGSGVIDISASAPSGTAVLSFGGDVADTETVTINSRVYEFDTNSSITGDVAVDVSGGVDKDSAGAALASAINGDGSADVTADYDSDTNELTVTAIIGGVVGNYTVSETMGNGSWSGNMTGGTNCSASNAKAATLNDVDEATVTLASGSGDTIVLTAVTPGTAGDSIGTTETCTNAAFDDTTLGTTTAGVDCTAANAVTALVAAIEGDWSGSVSAEDGTGDTVVATAKIPGTAGDAITTTEAMANGAWDDTTLGATTAGVDCPKGDAQTALRSAINAEETDWQLGVFAADVATLTGQSVGTDLNDVATTETGAHVAWTAAVTAGGADGTVGVQWDILVDASYLYIAIAANDEEGANWRRVSLGSVF